MILQQVSQASVIFCPPVIQPIHSDESRIPHQQLLKENNVLTNYCQGIKEGARTHQAGEVYHLAVVVGAPQQVVVDEGHNGKLFRRAGPRDFSTASLS